MNMLKEVVQVPNEGLNALIGEMVLIICNNYFYYGKLIGVNETCIKLEKPYKVFETGPYGESTFKDAQRLPVDSWYVQTGHIESFGKSFKTV